MGPKVHAISHEHLVEMSKTEEDKYKTLTNSMKAGK